MFYLNKDSFTVMVMVTTPVTAVEETTATEVVVQQEAVVTQEDLFEEVIRVEEMPIKTTREENPARNVSFVMETTPLLNVAI